MLLDKKKTGSEVSGNMHKRKNAQRPVDPKTVLTNLATLMTYFNRHESTWLRISTRDLSEFFCFVLFFISPFS